MSCVAATHRHGHKRRIYPQWNQTLTVHPLVWQSDLDTMVIDRTVSIVQGTGRLSCSDPNLQSLPNAGAHHSAKSVFHRCALFKM